MGGGATTWQSWKHYYATKCLTGWISWTMLASEPRSSGIWSVHLPRSLLDVLSAISNTPPSFTSSVISLHLCVHTQNTKHCIARSAARAMKYPFNYPLHSLNQLKMLLLVSTQTVANDTILNIQCMHEKVKYMKIRKTPVRESWWNRTNCFFWAWSQGFMSGEDNQIHANRHRSSFLSDGRKSEMLPISF